VLEVLEPGENGGIDVKIEPASNSTVLLGNRGLLGCRALEPVA
jgi:hypothetical protein